MFHRVQRHTNRYRAHARYAPNKSNPRVQHRRADPHCRAHRDSIRHIHTAAAHAHTDRDAYSQSIAHAGQFSTNVGSVAANRE